MGRVPELSALPEPESARLGSAVGNACTALKLAVMSNCGEEFAEADARGLHEVTWGVLLELSNDVPLALSWIQDAHGQPNRIWCPDPDWFATIESVTLQRVDHLSPWRDFIGRPLTFFDVHTYPSNWGAEKTWHNVPWGIELAFGDLRMLVASAYHGHALVDPICNDEIVLAYTPTAIASMIGLRRGYVEEWS